MALTPPATATSPSPPTRPAAPATLMHPIPPHWLASWLAGCASLAQAGRCSLDLHRSRRQLAALQQYACLASCAGSSAQRQAGITSVGVVSSDKGRGAGSVYAHARALQSKGVGHSSTLVRRAIACATMTLISHARPTQMVEREASCPSSESTLRAAGKCFRAEGTPLGSHFMTSSTIPLSVTALSSAAHGCRLQASACPPYRSAGAL